MNVGHSDQNLKFLRRAQQHALISYRMGYFGYAWLAKTKGDRNGLIILGIIVLGGTTYPRLRCPAGQFLGGGGGGGGGGGNRVSCYTGIGSEVRTREETIVHALESQTQCMN